MPAARVRPLPEAPGPRHGHGPRLDPSRDADLRAAALELVAEVGYDRLTIDMVAARAGAGKATVYRRWANKAQLVADALLARQADRVEVDTGSLRGDLDELCRRLSPGSESPDKARLIAGLVSAMLTDPALRDALATFVTPPELEIATIIDRAVARGEIAAPKDAGLVASVVPALCLHRLIESGEVSDATFLDQVISSILLPALIAPPQPARSEPGGAPRRARREEH